MLCKLEIKDEAKLLGGTDVVVFAVPVDFSQNSDLMENGLGIVAAGELGVKQFHIPVAIGEAG